jgi:KamA family protein
VDSSTPKYKAYSLQNYRDIPQLRRLPDEVLSAMNIVGLVLPFKTNHYVIDHLIDWKNALDDPMFILTFPQRGMLLPEHYDEMEWALKNKTDRHDVQETANNIRLKLNPHPAGQLEHNVPMLGDQRLHGMQHKYRETVLFFPSQGQTCHAYCTFCFRWPQFVGMNEFKFASRETQSLVDYLKAHPEVMDILFTGGDPMIMRAKHLAAYMEPLLADGLPNLRRIRIGTKALSYWPYRFTHDDDADELMTLLKKIIDAGKHLAIMAHFNHPVELSTPAVREAIKRLRGIGAEIRTQSPVLSHINDKPDVWAKMWTEQVNLGLIPYYMFVVRDTGAQHYFGVPLVRAWEIFRDAYQQTSGLSRTARGPSMSSNPGKAQVLGVSEINGERVIVLRFLQGRNPKWVQRPFFAKYNDKAMWIDDLEPVNGDKFFFEEELENFYREKIDTVTVDDFE